MAIDDNTSYELTGAQVKDLASKINAKADSSSLATVATSGSYNDLLDKPTIPTVNDGTLTIQQNGTTVGTFTANQSSAATVSLTDTTYSVMTGASSGAAGTSGLVPAPAAGDEAKVLSGAGTWVNQSGGGGSSSVTYYAASSSTQGFSTYYTYLYSDAARTTVVTPDTILSNFENGDTVLIEFESTDTGSSAYKMTLSVTTMTLDGDNMYRMTVIELNEYNTNYNCVTACLSATWDGQSSFNGRWGIVRNTRPVVNDGTLTIQHNGTTKGTFTANQGSASTVNIETATKTSDLTNDGNGTTGSAYVATTDTSTVSTSMIANGAVTNAKIDWSTCNVIIDSSPTASTFFGGSYSKTFTVPEDGYYEISTPFSCIAHRVANAQSALYVAIDSSTKFTYSYMSTSGDTEWGTNRRTIGSVSFIVALTAGQHTLSTSGNLYYDSSTSGYTAISSFYAKYFAPSS